MTVRSAVTAVGTGSRLLRNVRHQRMGLPVLVFFLSIGCSSSTGPSANRPDSPVQGACRFSVAGDASNLTVGAAGVTLPVSVATTAGCVWGVETQADFITIADLGGGSGNGTVRLAVTPNAGGQRSGTVSIARVTLTITQTAPSSVDQSFLPTAQDSRGFFAFPNTTVSQGQTFTGSVSGQLTGADIVVGFAAFGGPPRDVIVQVRSTSGGLPVSSTMTSGRIPASAVPEDALRAFTHVEFAPAVTVTAGQTLALVVFTEEDNGNMQCLGTTGANYSGGNYVFSAGGVTWRLGQFSGGAQGDLFFQTYVAR